MPDVLDLTVPDLGDFHDVPIVEVLVKPGDRVDKDAPLVTLESEKATMEVPSVASGVVRDITVKVGDKVSSGSVLGHVEAAAQQSAAPATPNGRSSAAQTDAPTAPTSASPSPAPAPPASAAEVSLTVPDIGDFHDVPVIDVLVHAGDRIERDAPLVTLESEKASMDVPAEVAGQIVDVKLRVGDRVSKGAVVATLRPAASEQQPAQQAAQQPAPPTQQRSEPQASSLQPSSPSRDGGPAGVAVHASPAIRRFARELGVDLARVSGSGPNRRITKDDVQSFVKRSLSAPSTGDGAGLGLAVAPWPRIDFAQFGPVERVPRSRIKRISGPNLHRNWVTIPHVTQNDDADVTELEQLRVSLNAEQRDVKVTMLPFLMKAAVAALRRFPDFNASLDGDELVLKRYYHVGFAADTPGGLVVPVVRDVDRKGVLEVAKETAELAKKARDGKLSASDMQGGTFTISSLGGIGGTYFSPIINAPEVAILGACRAATRPVWDGGAFVPRLMLPLSLSYDHRVIDGAAAARFIVFLGGLLADMRRALL